MASGTDWAQPWSVMAMAWWPQAAACFTAAVVSVRASMLDMLVCRCNSTRLFSAVSKRLGALWGRMAMGSRTISLSNRLITGLAKTFTQTPTLVASTMAWAFGRSRSRKYRLIRMEPV